MYRQEVMEIIKNKVAFLGTVDGAYPRVRPMKPHLCQHGRIWLVSHLLSKKVEEITHNNRVELCFIGDSQDVLRLSGILDVFSDLTEEEIIDFKRRILKESPEMNSYFTGPDDPLMVLHRLRVYHVTYTTKDNEVRTPVDVATEDDPDILFATEQGFFLS